MLRKDAGPFALRIEKFPTLRTVGWSSVNPTKNETGLKVTSKKYEAHSDPVSKKRSRNVTW